MKNNIIFLILLFVTLRSATNASAQVIINEVYPNPTASQSEWIELYNGASESANLNGWTLEDQLSSPSILHEFSEEIIDGLGFLVVNLTISKLNNSADGVTLKNAAGEIVDQMSYKSSTAGKSWALVNGDLPAGEAGWWMVDSSPGEINPEPNPTLSPSPNPSPTVSPSPTPVSNIQYPISNIQLSEVSPCPISGELEWIEIFNNFNNLINLDNWKIRDSSGNSKTINLTVNPQSLDIITWSSSLLNNSGDSVILEASNGQKAFEIAFGECSDKGNTFIYYDNAWRETSQPTKGTSNIYNDVENNVILEEVSANAETDDRIPSEIPSNILTGSYRPAIAELQDDNIFTPPINPTGLVLGTNIDKSTGDLPAQAGDLTNLKDGKTAIANAILGGLLLASGSSYKLYEWYQKNIDFKL